MPFPFMIGSLIFLPAGISALAIIGLLVAGFQEMMRGHIGRIGIALNVILLWQIFYPVWNILPELLQWYLNIGTIVMIIALISYSSIYLPIKYIPLPSEFYEFAFYAYGSISIIVIVWAVFFSGIPLKLI